MDIKKEIQLYELKQKNAELLETIKRKEQDILTDDAISSKLDNLFNQLSCYLIQEGMEEDPEIQSKGADYGTMVRTHKGVNKRFRVKGIRDIYVNIEKFDNYVQVGTSTNENYTITIISNLEFGENMSDAVKNEFLQNELFKIPKLLYQIANMKDKPKIATPEEVTQFIFPVTS